MTKQAKAIIAAYAAERATMVERMVELDEVFVAGNGTKELEAEYYAADARERELNRLIHAAGAPRRNICANTQALVSANID